MSDCQTPDFQTIVLEKKGAVAAIWLDRPQSLNAFNTQLRAELALALDAVEKDAEVRVAILGSTGKAFSSGADLLEGFPENQTIEEQILQEYAPLLARIASMEKPVIAAVPGVMAGVGVSFALQCDLLVMAETGALVVAFSNVGLIPDGGASWLLLQHLGYQRAYQLIAEGGRLNAQQCLDAGIANQLAPADKVNEVALEWAQRLAQRAPIALGKAKTVLRKAAALSYGETLALEARIQNICIGTEDSKEAVKAFREKRTPVFKGR